MDENFTNLLSTWLNTPAEQRNLTEGALLLLRVNHNRIMYLNIMRAPEKYAADLEYQIRKWYNFRLQQQTHAQVEQMAVKAEKIAQAHNLYTEQKKSDTTDAAEKDSNDNSNSDTQTQGNATGRRADHDTLPDEIQALYAENLDILHRMREVHLRLRTMSREMEGKQMCPDSDRFPFLKELISLDKQYHQNWEQYDNYKANA